MASVEALIGGDSVLATRGHSKAICRLPSLTYLLRTEKKARQVKQISSGGTTVALAKLLGVTQKTDTHSNTTEIAL